MKNGTRIIRDHRFAISIAENGCVDKIMPLVDSVCAKIEAIAANYYEILESKKRI
jgi:hypothetical protein